MQVLAVGDAAALCCDLSPDAVLPLYRGLVATRRPAVTDIVPAEDTILVRFDPGQISLDAMIRWVRSAPSLDAGPESRDLVTVPVRYDGVDLTSVADTLGIDVDAVVELHTCTEWTVAFLGFAPGFGYLVHDGLDSGIPRHREPRRSVPSGSVALAGRYTAVYPRDSPGGWQLIGRTDLPLWDDDRDPPALLTPGTRVRFHAV